MSTEKTRFSVGATGELYLAERVIPVPKSISPAAQKFLSVMAKLPPEPPAPPVSDMAAWVRHREIMDCHPLMMASDEQIAETGSRVFKVELGGVTVYKAIPGSYSTGGVTEKIYIDIHGGSLVFGGGKGAALSAARHASWFQCVVYSIDYRMPPENPFPAGLYDCLKVYEEIIKTNDSSNIAIGGISAGGNLAAALALKIRDLDVASPGAVVLLTPELDLTESGDSFQTNRDIDVVQREGMPRHIALYANGVDLRDPYVSPLFADFSKGFPPTFIHSGTRDIFLSNAVRMQRALRQCDIYVDLQLWEAMPHGWFVGCPEEGELLAEVRRFLNSWCWLGLR